VKNLTTHAEDGKKLASELRCARLIRKRAAAACFTVQ
jgi:hypothetical protein